MGSSLLTQILCCGENLVAEDKAYVNRIQMDLANHLVWLVIPSLFSISREKLEYIWTFNLSWGPIDRFNLAA